MTCGRILVSHVLYIACVGITLLFIMPTFNIMSLIRAVFLISSISRRRQLACIRISISLDFLTDHDTYIWGYIRLFISDSFEMNGTFRNGYMGLNGHQNLL